MTPEHTYELLATAGLGKVCGSRRLREIAALIAADSQAHSYPQMTDWIGTHGDQLVREADRRGLPTLDALLTLMLDDVFPVYTDATDAEIAEDREYAAGAEQPPTQGDEPPINPGVQAFTERTRQGWGLPASTPIPTELPLIPPTRGPWARPAVPMCTIPDCWCDGTPHP